MIFKGLLFEQGSGSIGGLTVSHNKGGGYIKARSNPTNPNSTRQQATRTALSFFASEWTIELTQVQRDEWNAYAQNHTIKNALGEDIYINGINWFIMFSTRLWDALQPYNLSPPPGAVPTPNQTFSVDVSALNTADLTFTPAIEGAWMQQLWMTLPGTSGQTPNFKQARLVGYTAPGQASPWAATLPFSVQSGKQCTFYGCVMNQYGQISAFSNHTDLADY